MNFTLLEELRLAELLLDIGELGAVGLKAVLDLLHDALVGVFALLLADLALVVGEESNSYSLGTEATGTANTVEVLVGLRGHIVLDDEVNAVNVDTTAHKVGGNNNTGLVALAGLVHLEALALLHTAVHSLGGELELVEKAGEGLATLDGANEDDALVEVDGVEDIHQATALVGLGAVAVELLKTVEGELSLLINVDLGGVVHELTGDVAELISHGGGEHHDLLGLGGVDEDVLNVSAHADILEAAVELINDEPLDLLSIEGAILDERVETAGGADNDGGDLLLELANVLDLAHAAVEAAGGAVGKVLVEALELILELESELAGMSDDNSLAVGLLALGDLLHLLKESEDENSGLTHTGLGLGKNVGAKHSLGESLVLNLGRVLETILTDSIRELGLQAEVSETSEGNGGVGTEADSEGLDGGGGGGDFVVEGLKGGHDDD